MKKILSLLLALALVFSLAACGAQPGPEKVVGQFCEDMKAFNYSKVSQYINADEEVSELVEEADDETSKLVMDHLKEWAGQMTYEVGAPAIDGDHANVTVNFHYKDAAPILTSAVGEYFQQGFALAFTGASEEEMQQLFEKILVEKLNESSPSTVDAAVTFPCTKTDNGWEMDEVPQDAVNVMLSNVLTALDNMESLGE